MMIESELFVVSGETVKALRRATYMLKRLLRQRASVCGVFFLGTLLWGQDPQPAVQGRVLDASGAPVAAALVEDLVKSSSRLSQTTTDDNGAFSLALGPGMHRIQVTKPNFTAQVRPVAMEQADVALADIVLSVNPTQSSIVVTDSADYTVAATSSSTRTLTPLRDIPQTINVVTQQQVQDQLMLSIGDLIRYVPGVSVHQGENNRDEIIIRGNDTSANFFLNGMRDDVQYYRDLYNVDRVEVLQGANALAFGRGGGGGVVNRVTKEPGPTPLRELVLEGGSYSNKRVAADFDQSLSDKFAFRMNAVYENSDSFRRSVGLERYALNPSLAYSPSSASRVVASFEHLYDNRTADRGVTSLNGSPAPVPIDMFYGNPSNSFAFAKVNGSQLSIEHQAGVLTIHNRSYFANYDRKYQNYVPGVASADASLVSLSAYNNATDRTNLINQTDLIYATATGRVHHTLLAGIDVERQLTDNFRNTGYFNNSVTSISLPFFNPTISTSATFLQNATDADNHLRTNVGAAYVQDQVELSRFLQLTAGVRFDHFDLQFHNNRTEQDLRRIDNLVSPRAALVFKPVTPLSLYLSYNVGYLPSSGDQFSSLTNITAQVKPEKFSNYEAGVKWDVRRGLALTAAVYRLDRENTRSTDPNDPTRIIQTGSQRSNGVELGATGAVTRHWRVSGGYAYQDAFITSATTAARALAQVGQTPHHMFSLWNHYQILPRWSAGLGLLNRSNMFVGVDNTVVVPSFFRADAAVFYSVTEKIRFQVNVENLIDRKYYTNADSNTNISPGSPRAVRAALVFRF